MQLVLELADQLVGRADQQPVEAALLVGGERDVGDVDEVVVLLLLDAALVARLRPAALVVLAVHVVLDAVGLLEAAAVADEEARVAAVGEQHAPALGVGVGDQRLDVRRALEHDGGVDRAAEPDDLEQVGGPAGVHGDGARAVLRDVAGLQRLAHALDVRLQRLALVVVEPFGLLDAVRGLGEDRGDRRRSGRRRGELGRIEVQEDGQDAAALRLDVGEPAQLVAGDRVGCHEGRLPSLCRGGTPVGHGERFVVRWLLRTIVEGGLRVCIDGAPPSEVHR